MLKSFVRAGLLLGIGAGLGIWFAPTGTRHAMAAKLGIVQGKASEFHQHVGSRWLASAEKSLASMPKVDVSKLNREQFATWVDSAKKTYATVSDEVIRTKKTVDAVGLYFEKAKDDIRKGNEQLAKI